MTHSRSMPEIIQLASAFYGSSVLFAAIEADVFSAIEACPSAPSAKVLAERTGLDPRGLRLLLDGAVACGLLEKQADSYLNTSVAKQCLVRGAVHDLTGAIRYNHDVYGAWGKLTQLVQSGEPVEAPQVHLGDDRERTRNFALAMHGRAMGIGQAVVPMLKFPRAGRVLDLAGGPGTYAVLIAQANPHMTCETRDLPAISQVAQELVQRSSVADRVICKPGDYHTDTYEPNSVEAVTIFGALHQESPEQIVEILARAHGALVPGGVIYILDMMTDDTHTYPAFSALFAINMALTTHNGWVFSDKELQGWLEKVGFAQCQTRAVPPPMPHWLVTATKPTT